MWIYFKKDNQLINLDKLVEIKKENFTTYEGPKYNICLYGDWNGTNLKVRLYTDPEVRDHDFEQIRSAIVYHSDYPETSYYCID